MVALVRSALCAVVLTLALVVVAEWLAEFVVVLLSVG